MTDERLKKIRLEAERGMQHSPLTVRELIQAIEELKLRVEDLTAINAHISAMDTRELGD